MPLSSAEVTVSVSVPITTVTLTPLSVPVSPLILNPAAFSATLMTSSVVIGVDEVQHQRAHRLHRDGESDRGFVVVVGAFGGRR